jgi:hypothetical protein
LIGAGLNNYKKETFMENLQKLVPFFQQLLQEWYELTMHNQEYAICLAVSVWLLTAIFYSIRIGFLKRQVAQMAAARLATQTGLDEANGQLQTLQQQLTEATEKTLAAEQAAQAETERANGINARLNDSNQQLVGSLSNLVASFELNQPNLPSADSANLLTEYAAILARVVERFQNEQQAKTQLQLSFHAESAKLADKDILIDSLQSRLDNQTQQLAKLELANEEYQVALRQLELDKQNLNAALQQQRQAQPVQVVGTEKPTVQVVPPVIEPVVASPVSQVAAVDLSTPALNTTTVKPVEVSQPVVDVKPAPSMPAEPVAVSAPKTETKPAVAAKATKPKPAKAESGKLKGLFGRAMDKIAKMDQTLGFEANPKPTMADDDQESVPEVLEKPEQAIEAVASNVTQTVEDVVVEAKAELVKKEKKLSGMLGKLKFKK